MTVGDLIDALERYDRERIVIFENSAFERVISIEPGGAVMLRPVHGKIVNQYDCEITAKKKSTYMGIFGNYSDDDDD